MDNTVLILCGRNVPQNSLTQEIGGMLYCYDDFIHSLYQAAYCTPDTFYDQRELMCRADNRLKQIHDYWNSLSSVFNYFSAFGLPASTCSGTVGVAFRLPSKLLPSGNVLSECAAYPRVSSSKMLYYICRYTQLERLLDSKAYTRQSEESIHSILVDVKHYLPLCFPALRELLVRESGAGARCVYAYLLPNIVLDEDVVQYSVVDFMTERMCWLYDLINYSTVKSFLDLTTRELQSPGRIR
jgi:hypothetical protein